MSDRNLASIRRNRLGLLITAALTFACTVLASPVQADVLLSNLPGTPSGTGSNLGLNTDGIHRMKGAGLTLGSDPFFFDSLTALISNTSPATELRGGIYSDSGGIPGALLAAFVPVAIPENLSVQEVTIGIAGSFTLDANTTYWFILDGPSSFQQSLLWQSLSPNTAPTPAPGMTFTGYRFSSNGGATWSNSTIFNGIQINGTLVPGPATLALLGVAGLLGARRRRRC